MLKKLHLKLVLLLTAMVMGAGNVWGEEKTWTHAFASPEAISNDAITVGGVTWNVSTTSGAGSPAMTTGNSHSAYGLKFGSSKSIYYGSVTFTTSAFSGYNVKSVSINVLNNGTQSGTLSAQQGSTLIGSVSQTFGQTWTDLTVNTNRGSGGELSFTYTVQQAFFIHSITVVYETPDVSVPVTGISLDKSAITLEVGETGTLKPTITPASATNMNINWKSGNDDVATVEAGVVTAIGVGVTTITATTVDGSFTATCDVTVNAASSPTVTFDFTDTDWEFPSDYDKTEKSYTNGGYTITFGESSGGHKAMISGTNQIGIIFGTQNATISFPAFSFKVSKIKVYGLSGASGKVTMNIFVGSTAVSTEATSSKETHVFEIAPESQTAGTVYVFKVTNANNAQISKIEVFGYENVDVTSAGYATYCSGNALDFSGVTGLTAFKATLKGDNVTFDSVGEVPGGEGLLVEGSEGTFRVPVIAEATSIGTNALVGVTEATVIHGTSGNYYVLNQKGKNVGFYKVASANYTVRANSAYLALPASAKEFIGFGDETAVEAVAAEVLPTGTAYNLQGQRVGNDYKGVVIVNGKKVIR